MKASESQYTDTDFPHPILELVTSHSFLLLQADFYNLKGCHNDKCLCNPSAEAGDKTSTISEFPILQMQKQKGSDPLVSKFMYAIIVVQRIFEHLLPAADGSTVKQWISKDASKSLSVTFIKYVSMLYRRYVSYILWYIPMSFWRDISIPRWLPDKMQMADLIS